MSDQQAPQIRVDDYVKGNLSKDTNWWGAFVIGLAGTILVTGIAPVMVTELGAASVPVIVIITITGYLVCLLLAELSAMMPEAGLYTSPHLIRLNERIGIGFDEIPDHDLQSASD